MAEFSANDVKRLAELARIHIDDTQTAPLANELNDIVDYVRILQSVPSDSEPPTEAMSTLREDIICPSLDRQQLLERAPNRTTDGFIVPRVVG